MMAYTYNRNNDRTNETIEVEIVKHIGDLMTLQSGWVKELNIVSWNGAAPKFDIREWSPDHERMSRGITLYEEEVRKLADLVNKELGKASQVKVKIRDETKSKEVASSKEDKPPKEAKDAADGDEAA